jgi:hypothetical protein
MGGFPFEMRIAEYIAGASLKDELKGDARAVVNRRERL